MTSKQTTQKRLSFKFLARNLRIRKEEDDERCVWLRFQQIRAKRVYLKSLCDLRLENYGPNSSEIIYKPFKKMKVLKTLKTFRIPSMVESYPLEILKYSKNIKTFSINSPKWKPNLHQVVLCLNRLPATIKTCTLHLSIRGGASFKDERIATIAKVIRRFPNLEYLQRNPLSLYKRRSSILQELRIYSQSVKRLKKLKQFMCDGIVFEEVGFQGAMRRNQVYPGITGFQMQIRDFWFPNYGQFEPFFERNNFNGVLPDPKDMNIAQQQAYKRMQDHIKIEDNSKDNVVLLDEDDVESIVSFSPEHNPFLNDRDFLVKCRMREEIKPFYRFGLFPDLKTLNIKFTDILFPLGSFVIDGFTALKKLEDLKIGIDGRPMGTFYLFKGFLELPLLKKFSLTINFLSNDEWELLKQFTRNQHSLRSFSLKITSSLTKRSTYFQQSIHLKNIIELLNNKDSLRFVKLKSHYWHLEPIFQGLSQLKIKNQLHTLSLEGSDALIDEQQTSGQRVSEFCNFLKTQKESLKTLHISLPLVIDDEILTHILKSISELSHLQNLKIKINHCYPKDTSEIQSYFEDVLLDIVPQSSQEHAWNPNVQPLERLQNLDTFTLWVTLELLGENEFNTWLVDILSALSRLPKLKKIWVFFYSEETFGLLPQKMINPILELKNTLDIDIQNFDDVDSPDEIFESARSQFDDALWGMRERQATRCELMF